MSTTRRADKPRGRRLGTAGLVLFVVACVAPMAAVVSIVPLGMYLGNGAGFVGAIIIAGLILCCFAAGYVALSRHVINAGAFYAYIAKGLGKPIGVAGSFIAMLAYNAAFWSLAGAIGFAMLPALGSLGAGAVMGLHLGVLTTAGAALIAGAGGFLAPDYQVREKATTVRGQMRHDLSAYLDLTVITLAGGAGTEGALTHAASSGAGVTFARIRSALTRGAHLGRPVSETFNELGEQTGVAEFTELGSNLALAGHEGARIRAVLSTKAATMRKQALAGEQAKAGAATERLSLPMVLLVLGFLVYIGFPAVSAVTSSLGG